MKDCVPGSCVTGTVARPTCLDMVVGNAGGQRRRIRSAVYQLSESTGGADADALIASRDAAFAARERRRQLSTGDARLSLTRRIRLESVESAGFSPTAQRLWTFDRSTEIALMEEMLLRTAQLVGVKSPPTKCVHTLVASVASRYPENDFHSFTHACDVTISAYVLLTKFGGAARLRPIDAFTLIVTAMMHDVAHPGRTNKFEATTESELVAEYGEKGTYERLHAETAKSILETPGCEIFAAAGFSVEDQRWAMDLLEYTIFGTDIGCHKSIMDEWGELFPAREGEEAGTSKLDSLDMTDERRRELVRMLMKTSDLGCCAKPWAVARHW